AAAVPVDSVEGTGVDAGLAGAAGLVDCAAGGLMENLAVSVPVEGFFGSSAPGVVLGVAVSPAAGVGFAAAGGVVEAGVPVAGAAGVAGVVRLLRGTALRWGRTGEKLRGWDGIGFSSGVALPAAGVSLPRRAN